MSKDFLRFVETDERCRIKGISYPGVPIFFDGAGIIESVSDYMLHLRCTEGHPEGTVKTYAFHMQKYLKFLRGIATDTGYLDWREVTDQTLIAWRDKMTHLEELLDSTANGYLCTVFEFYIWAETSGRIKNVLAIYDHANSTDKVYQIAATRTGKGRWIWPYLLKVKHRPDRNTPTPAQLEQVHINAFENSTTGKRDSLILSLYEDMGLRESEALGLTVNDIPSWDEIEEAHDEDRIFTLEIWGKGKKKRYVPALPELMRWAREYIEGDRADVVSRAKMRNPAYQPPKALLLSQSTGKKLNRQYLSRRLSELLKASGIQDASGHRVRATYIETQVEASDGYDQTGRPLPAEQVLWKVGEKVGHSSPLSTRPYLNKVRARAYATKADQMLDETGRLNVIQRRLAEKTGTLKRVEDLHTVAEALQKGKNQEAISLLAALAEKLSDT